MKVSLIARIRKRVGSRRNGKAYYRYTITIPPHIARNLDLDVDYVVTLATRDEHGDGQ